MVKFAQMPMYEEYVSSEADWLGDVPASWELTRLGTRFLERRAKASDVEYPPLSVTRNGILPQLESAAKSKDGDNRKLVKAGDFVINSRSDRKGSSGVSDRDGSVSLISIVLEPKNIHPKFCHHLLKSYAFIEEYYRVGRGIVADLWTTRYSEMRTIIIAIPTYDEQTLIANFLDQKTAQIDAAITIKEQQIELLKERKQIIIQQAVTQGLDPNVPMKDSGIEWIGQIPEHWETVPLKHLCKFSGGGTPSKDNLSFWKDGTIPWVSPKDMKSSYISKTQDYITEKAVKNSSTNYVKPNSLLLVVRSGILQRKIPVAINTVQVTLNQDMKSLSFSKRMTVNFMMSYILGNNDALLFEWIKEGATVESVEHEYLACSLVTVPPIEEQREIEKYVLKISQETDDAIYLQQQQIQKLKEYKTTLINSAVTGKIKITPEMLQA